MRADGYECGSCIGQKVPWEKGMRIMFEVHGVAGADDYVCCYETMEVGTRILSVTTHGQYGLFSKAVAYCSQTAITLKSCTHTFIVKVNWTLLSHRKSVSACHFERPRGRDEIRSQSTTYERWIPPSAIKRDALPENSDDVKFRKVRAILNKLTPQTFDKLSDEVINIGLDSPVLLKGFILLIFEKALQEPKYVCMYAQLCKKLNKKVPNFDPPNPEYTTTFRRLLLSKCQDEYENRARASAAFDHRTERLTPEEEEEKQISKLKMLGNIKFIGELGKLEMLTHSILHKCCEELVKKTKAEDLECLCQIMSTCGHLLDNDKGKYLMDQYFARMKELSINDKLPSRIRFMLQDVLELRENHWLPRQSTSRKESPKSIDEIHREAKDEMGITDYQQSDVIRSLQFDARTRNNRFGNKKNRTGMEDVFAPVPLAVTSLGTGPGVITPGDKPMGIETNGYHHSNSMNNYRPAGGMRNYMPNNMQSNGSFYPQMKNNKINHYMNQQDHHNPINIHQNRNIQNNSMHNGYEKAPVAPRFLKQGGNHMPQMPPVPAMTATMPVVSEELSLRPPPNSMKMFPVGQIYIPNLKNANTEVLQPAKPAVPILPKEPPLLAPVKNAVEKVKPKKEKGPTKEGVIKRVEEIVEEFIKGKNENESAEDIRQMKIPDRFISDMLTSVLNKAMDRNETERERVYTLVMYIIQEELVTRTQFIESFRNMLDLMGDLEADIPRIKSYVAAYAARAVTQQIISLSEVAEPMEGGNHYPFLLLVLQQLSKTMDKHKVTKLFDESKINLLNTLPKTDRTKDRMADILEERELSFLFPLLKIQAEMAKQLQSNSDSLSFFTWIKENVDSDYHTSQGFISALVTVIVKFVTAETSQNLGSEQTEKATKEKEKELLLKFKPVIENFLHRVDLQVVAIYALQATWFALESPKVMLLRWFMNMYELEIIEEEAFLKWKEDIRDDYPGKGNALFQVNQWLLWLEQADEEEEEDEELDEDQIRV
ncbi:unnamed protein product [Allacma fusca]|uniref:Eukaryotic translation initiation factor 4 gamma 2 n=1 Tax=Allacma fusca TaxID=39272 RepID=A0A8J2KTA8_9HEXA|nr:unnamed protein product [Allacma fusca]